MKHFLLLFFVINLAQAVQSQVVFSPPGAEWRYSFFWGFPYRIENEKIAYVRDSTLGGAQVKVLAHRRFYSAYNPFDYKLTLIRQVGDTVFFRSEITEHTWQILYNYAAQAGQSWQTTIQLDDINTSIPVLTTHTVSVDSVKNVIVNSVNLRRLFVKYSESNVSTYSRVITERFGADPFMFNYSNLIDGSDYDMILYFLCYKDNVFGVKQFTNYSCDYSDYMSISENYSGSGLGVYPNPSAEVLHIKELNSYAVRKMEIVDGLGKIKTSIENKEVSDRIDISGLDGGMYLLKIYINQQQPFVFKFMKQGQD